MKLIIQIPAYNEANNIAHTVSQLPKNISGIQTIEYLVIDDGSTDQTTAVAQKAGVHHIVTLDKNNGLARAFYIGIQQAVKLSADIIVNTDADNQYCAQDIDKLIQPILENAADVVIGDRQPRKNKHYTFFKKCIHYVGSKFLSAMFGVQIPDAPSGFRAYSRKYALQLFVYARFTYTVETLFHALDNNFRIKFVPVRVNPPLRPSRLFTNIFNYISRLAYTTLEIYFLYRPHFFLFRFASISIFFAFLIGLRYIYHLVFVSVEEVFIPSLILCAILTVIGVGLFLLGTICNQLRINRRLLEKIVCEKRFELEN